MRKAFVVGLSVFDSPNIENLPYVVNDAKEFFKCITDVKLGGAVEEHSVVLLSPTRNRLRAATISFFKSLGPDDEFILYIAGHASYLPSGRLSFDCQDTDARARSLTGFDESDLRRALRVSPCTRGIVILDTCYAEVALKSGAQARGAVADQKFDTAADGTIVLWASLPHQKAVEVAGHGLFSGLLIEAIKVGADLPVDRECLTAEEAVLWTKERLKASPLSEQFWPGLRSSGQVFDLYLSRNPNFRAIDRTRQESRPIDAALAHLASRIGSSREDCIAQLRRIAMAVASTGVLPSRQPGIVVHLATSRLFGNWLLRSLGLSLWLLPVAMAIEYLVPGEGAIAGVISFTILLLLITRGALLKLFRRKSYFVMSTPQGFCISDGGEPSKPNLTLVPWDDVEACVRWSNDKDTYTVLRLARPIARSFEISFNNVDYKGGLPALERAIMSYFRIGEAPLAAASEFENASRADAVQVVAISAVSNYESLSALSSPAHDVDLICQVLEDTSANKPLVLQNADLGEYERWLKDTLLASGNRIVLLYFSGHGLIVDEELYVALRDTDIVSPSESAFPIMRLYDLVAEARLRHLILVLDCCFSGTAGRQFSFQFENNLRALFERNRSSITILAAASVDERALGYSGGPSIFTSAMLDMIRLRRSEGLSLRVSAVSDAVASRLVAEGSFQHHCRFASEVAEAIDLIPVSHTGWLAERLTERARDQEDRLKVAQRIIDLRGSLTAAELDKHSACLFECASTNPKTIDRDTFIVCTCTILFGAIYASVKFKGTLPLFGLIVIVTLAIFAATCAVLRTKRRRLGRRVLYVNRDGLVLNDLIIPAAYIGNVRLTASSDEMIRFAQRRVRVTYVWGTDCTIASESEPWSKDVSYICDAIRSMTIQPASDMKEHFELGSKH
jgi:uncharacterized caspase-like protein